jgi:hypothetical protein
MLPVSEDSTLAVVNEFVIFAVPYTLPTNPAAMVFAFTLVEE